MISQAMSKAASVLLLLLLLVLLGCPGQAAPPARGGSQAPGAASTARPPSLAAAPAPQTAAMPPLPDAVALSTEASPLGVALVIQNRGTHPVELGLEASVEREEVGSHSPATGSEELRLDCAPDAPRCVSLVPGAELRPAPWPAALARAQCGAGPRPAAAKGRYRIWVRGCSAGVEEQTAAFDVP